MEVTRSYSGEDRRKDPSGLPKRSDILVADKISSARATCRVLPLPNSAPLMFGRRGANGLGVAPRPRGESLPWTLGVAHEPRVSWPFLSLTHAWFLGGSFRRLLKVWTTPGLDFCRFHSGDPTASWMWKVGFLPILKNGLFSLSESKISATLSLVTIFSSHQTQLSLVI